MRPKIVSLVPSEIAIRPSRTSPVPTRLHGLSPDHATMRAGGKPYLELQKGERPPTMVDESARAGNFVSRPGAVACSAAGDHCFEARSIRFMPDPSPGSMGACFPARRDAIQELTRCTRSVAA
jgi:hypothetical protein